MPSSDKCKSSVIMGYNVSSNCWTTASLSQAHEALAATSVSGSLALFAGGRMSERKVSKKYPTYVRHCPGPRNPRSRRGDRLPGRLEMPEVPDQYLTAECPVAFWRRVPPADQPNKSR